MEEKVLGRIEVHFAHYLVENEIPWHPIYVLLHVKTLIPLIVLPAKQK
jgi:hypothetical protein